MAHWDVSSELRGEHGKWSKSGIAHRLAKEAETEGAKKEAGKIEAGHRVAYKGGNSVGTVHHLDEKGVPHVVWDRGRGKPVRTPAHHLSHVGEQHKSAPKPGAPERGAHETPSQSRHLDETLRKMAGRKPEIPGVPLITLRGTPGSEDRKTSLRARMMEHLNKEGKLAPNERLTLANRYADENYKSSKPADHVHYASVHQGRQAALNQSEAERAANRRRNLEPRAKPRPGHERTGPPPTRHPMAPEAKPIKYGDVPPERGANPEESMSLSDLKWRAERGDQKAQAEIDKRFGRDKPSAPSGPTAAQLQEQRRPRPGASHTRIMNRTSGRGGYSAEHLHNHTNDELFTAHASEKARLQSPTISYDATKDANKKADQLEKEMRRRGLDPNKPTTKTPGPAKSPDELRRMIAEMEAKQKAKTEAENKARFPGGSTTIRSGPMGGTEGPNATRGMRGGGMQVRSFAQVHQEYQEKNAFLQRVLQDPGKFGPGVLPANRRQLDALESELRNMGAKRTSGSRWELPPKEGTQAHAKYKLGQEHQSLTEQLRGSGYTPTDLASTRFNDLSSQLRAGEKTVVLKVPSGSEIQMSREMAQYLRDKATSSALAGNRPQRTTAERRAAQQSRLAEAAGRRGITNRRKAT